jgi:hypothetical protein
MKTRCLTLIAALAVALLTSCGTTPPETDANGNLVGTDAEVDPDDVTAAMTAYMDAWTAADYEEILARTSARCREVEQSQGMNAELQALIADNYKGATASSVTMTGPEAATVTVEGFMSAMLEADASDVIASRHVQMILEDGTWVVDECDEEQTPVATQGTEPQQEPSPEPEPSEDVYYENCTEVWEATGGPINSGDTGFDPKFDANGNGIGCETRP